MRFLSYRMIGLAGLCGAMLTSVGCSSIYDVSTNGGDVRKQDLVPFTSDAQLQAQGINPDDPVSPLVSSSAVYVPIINKDGSPGAIALSRLQTDTIRETAGQLELSQAYLNTMKGVFTGVASVREGTEAILNIQDIAHDDGRRSSVSVRYPDGGPGGGGGMPMGGGGGFTTQQAGQVTETLSSLAFQQAVWKENWEAAQLGLPPEQWPYPPADYIANP